MLSLFKKSRKKKFKLPNTLVVLVVSLMAYKIYEGVTKGGDDRSETNSDLSEVQARSKALTLWETMRYHGTDEARIMSTLRGMTQANYNKIANAFGTKPYNLTLGMEGGFLSSKFTLGEMLFAELTATEMLELRNEMPDVAIT